MQIYMEGILLQKIKFIRKYYYLFYTKIKFIIRFSKTTNKKITLNKVRKPHSSNLEEK